MSRTRAVGEQEDVVLLAPILKFKTDSESVNKDTFFILFLNTSQNLVLPSSINIDRLYN
jgi:hypothetical protein